MSNNIMNIQEYKKEKLREEIRREVGEEGYREALKTQDIRDLEVMLEFFEDSPWGWKDWKTFLEREMQLEAERILAEVEADPDSKNWKSPEDAYEKLMKRIREKEEGIIK